MPTGRQVGFSLAYLVVFLAAGFGCAAPWLTTVTQTDSSGTATDYTTGFILMDTSFTMHVTGSWCSETLSALNTTAATKCSSVQTTMLIMMILEGLGVIFALVVFILMCCHMPRATFFLSGMPFFFITAGGFGYVFHVIPSIKEMFYSNQAATAVTFKYGYAAWSALGGCVLSFIFALVYCLTWKSTKEAMEAKLKENEEVDNKKKNDGEKKAEKKEEKKKEDSSKKKDSESSSNNNSQVKSGKNKTQPVEDDNDDAPAVVTVGGNEPTSS